MRSLPSTKPGPQWQRQSWARTSGDDVAEIQRPVTASPASAGYVRARSTTMRQREARTVSWRWHELELVCMGMRCNGIVQSVPCFHSIHLGHAAHLFLQSFSTMGVHSRTNHLDSALIPDASVRPLIAPLIIGPDLNDLVHWMARPAGVLGLESAARVAHIPSADRSPPASYTSLVRPPPVLPAHPASHE